MSYSLENLEEKMSDMWQEILSSPLADEIQQILASGDKKLYGMWLCQVFHLTKHTSAHQALVGTRFTEITHTYMKFCYEHALEEVGHEMMAYNDLKKIGVPLNDFNDLPHPLPATEKLNAYLYYISQHSHPATRLGFSYWAEKCYPFIQTIANGTKESLGLDDHQMTFFVSHSEIDEKHADDVEKIITRVCETEKDWKAVEEGMVNTLKMAVNIFEEIFASVQKEQATPEYKEFINLL